MDTIAFPIKFTNNHLVSIVQNTEEYYNQLISTALQVAPGEMPLDIDFGIRDLTFTDLADASIKQTLAFYFPEIDIDYVNVVKNTQTSNYQVDIAYSS